MRERAPGRTAGINPYYNLPPSQRLTQRLVDQFNAHEQLWRKLAPRRNARRKLRPRLSRRKLKRLALVEFAKARPPEECVGQWIEQQPITLKLS